MLVAVWNEEDRPAANRIANQLRARGIATDVAPTAAKLGKQIKYADKLGIPYVWFPATAAEGAEGAEPAGDEVKNIVTGEQVAADCTSWGRILWLPSKPSKSDVFARKIEEKQDNEPDGLQNTSCH